MGEYLQEIEPPHKFIVQASMGQGEMQYLNQRPDMSKSFSQMIKAVKHKSRLSNIDNIRNKMIKVPNVFHSFDMQGHNDINLTMDRSSNMVTLTGSQAGKKPDPNSSFAGK